MNRKYSINKKYNLLKKFKQEKISKPKRMKKTIPTIFVTDDSKENISLIKKRDFNIKNKKSRGVFIKVIKKNQIIMFVSALCLISVGYLAYNPTEETNFVSTTLDNSALADIGDATFVSSQKIVEEVEKSKENAVSNNVNNIEKNNINSKDLKENITNVDNSVNTVNTSATIKEQSDYFINSRIDRDKMYSQMLESYQKMLDNKNVSGEQKAIAVQEIAKINNQKNSIMVTENLIKTKGLEDVVIFINLDSISVVIKSKELKKEQIAQIQNIVTRELNVEISNVHISTR